MALETADQILMALGFFIVAVVYSSIGHAGASGYTAVMALFGFSVETMRPLSLFLNVVVGSLALIRYSRAGLVNLRSIGPFLWGSLPAAYWAVSWQVDRRIFYIVLGIVLLLAALNLFFDGRNVEEQPDFQRSAPIHVAVPTGVFIGLLSGLTGTGGAIFLTPLLLHFRWASPREASGQSVVFVLLNSIIGLVGFYQTSSSQILSWQIWPWVLAVFAGAMSGTSLGLHHLSNRSLKRIVALVLVLAALKSMTLAK